jgi:hypothetical protein
MVYKNHIQNIGMIPSETAANITNFYIVMMSLIDDANLAPGPLMEWVKQICQGNDEDIHMLYISNLALLLKNDYIMFYKLIDTGKKICESLSKDLEINYIPVFKDIKTPDELKKQLDIDYPDRFWEK